MFGSSESFTTNLFSSVEKLLATHFFVTLLNESPDDVSAMQSQVSADACVEIVSAKTAAIGACFSIALPSYSRPDSCDNLPSVFNIPKSPFYGHHTRTDFTTINIEYSSEDLEGCFKNDFGIRSYRTCDL